MIYLLKLKILYYGMLTDIEAYIISIKNRAYAPIIKTYTDFISLFSWHTKNILPLIEDVCAKVHSEVFLLLNEIASHSKIVLCRANNVSNIRWITIKYGIQHPLKLQLELTPKVLAYVVQSLNEEMLVF